MRKSTERTNKGTPSVKIVNTVKESIAKSGGNHIHILVCSPPQESLTKSLAPPGGTSRGSPLYNTILLIS